MVLACLGLAAASARADTKRLQTLELRQGWNSVYLEVGPTNGDPGMVFSNAPVDIVATFFPSDRPVEFVQNPSAIRWNKDGWGVWYAPRRQDAFLSTLFTIYGNRAFLIHAEQGCTVNLEGKVSLETVHWKSDSFNHIGFSLDAQSPPTFQKFFAGSIAHRNCRIYRLINDTWTPVLDAVGTLMRSGEAYWVYAEGGSDYQGPLTVKSDVGNGLGFLGQGTHTLTFVNNSPDPLSVTAELRDASVPLRYVAKAISPGKAEEVTIDLPAVYQLNTLEPGAASALRLQAKMEALTLSGQSTLLKISTDLGVVLWVPVAARRTDLSTNP
jgi:hypothetical protein